MALNGDRHSREGGNLGKSKNSRLIVIFGGTFDPVHNGHIAIARCLRDELGPAQVLMVPAGKPWLRDRPPVASPTERLRMVELATASETRIEVSDVDAIREGTTFSLDTIRDLRQAHGDEFDYILAVGSDAAATLHRWHRYDELAQSCTFAVIQRPGATLDTELPLPADTITIPGPMVDISASEIRALYARGKATVASRQVPTGVHEFIIESRLYHRQPAMPTSG
ncbi:MAG: nicotinate (nicotinamide) nucleotide adenylyltransferase [Chloroflexi bacterium]|nr:nicotinate (nicotinamide) nucleotide adenylyltransferase [Chloroflexota bacterium]